MECLSIFGKAVAKNRAFGNNISFLQQFFSISGGTFPVSPPGGAYTSDFTSYSNEKYEIMPIYMNSTQKPYLFMRAGVKCELVLPDHSNTFQRSFREFPNLTKSFLKDHLQSGWVMNNKID